jgi:hypothetical protein
MKARAIALAAMLLGCTRTVPQHHDGPQITHARETPRPLAVETSGSSCPLALPGTKVSFAPTSGGGSMLFSVSDEESLRDLRDRVRLLAADHNRASYRLAMVALPHRAEMVPIAGGARLDFVTGIGNDTLELQRTIETNGSVMLEKRCYETE